MSLDAMRRMKLLRDERHWDGRHQPTRVPRVTMSLGAVIAIAGCALMAAGDGGHLTLVGLVAFLTGLLAFIAANLRGISG